MVAAGLGHGVMAAVLGRCLKDIRRPGTIRGRTGMPSTARSEIRGGRRAGRCVAAITKRAKRGVIGEGEHGVARFGFPRSFPSGSGSWEARKGHKSSTANA